MKCDFEDGMKIDYSGSLTVRNGNEIVGYLVKETGLPDSIKNVLDNAARNQNCSELRRLTEELTRTDCGRVCIN